MADNIKINRRAKTETEAKQPLAETSVDNDKITVSVSSEDIAEEFNKEDLKALKRLSRDYEKSLEYYYVRTKPWRAVWTGFVSGMARGLGIAVGITVLAFILLVVLRQLEVLDLPIIGNFIAELLEYIEGVRRAGMY